MSICISAHCLCCVVVFQGYDLTLTLPGETVSTWSSDDQAALLADLAAFYADSSLTFSTTATSDVNGVLVIVVNVLGFSTATSADTSYDLISSGGIQLQSNQFSLVTASASEPAISCKAGFSIPSTSTLGFCADTDACLTVTSMIPYDS